MTWYPDGGLESVVEGSKTTTYVYDASGSRLLQKENGVVTAYLGDLEVKLTGTVKTATRYYNFAGATIAVRNASGLTWLASNDQGTATVAINAADTAAVERRRYTPYGELRGNAPTWPGTRGFVGGTTDATGMTHLGAREYDPVTGRFISVDEIIDQGDSEQMHGYSYASNNPTTYSDPTGLMRDDGGGGGGGGSGTTTTTDAGDGEIVLPPDLQAMLDDARRVQRMSLLDIILEAGGEILKEILGINDILGCFQRGDIVACISVVASIIPWAKIFKLPKIVKAIERAWSAVNAFWEKLKWAKRIVAQIDEFYQLARKAASEAAERVAQAARKAKAEAEAAAKAAKAKAESEAKQAAAKAAKERAEKEAKDAAKDTCKHSFAAGTRVLLADGSTKPIDQVEPGDTVVATDPETGQTTERVVTTQHINQDWDLTTVTLVDEEGTVTTLETTWHHPFWDATAGKWVDASELETGHKLQLAPSQAAEGTVMVAKVDSRVGTSQMFDLTVDTVHTYYVIVDDSAVLVHNCGKIELNDPGWTAAQKVEAQAKIDALDALAKQGKLVVTKVKRSNTVLNRIKRALGADARAGKDLDHVHDLQLGGVDEATNLKLLDLSVNRSFGSQIHHQIKNCPVGTLITHIGWA